jgi:fatty acid desaturase
MPAVVRIDPKTIFTREEWEPLTRRSSWRGFALVAHAWALILGAGAVFLWAPNPLTYVIAVMVIGARQLGLSILMHDAAHGTMHPDQRVNDFIGVWLCAAPVGADLHRYRPYHLRHHRYTEQPEDPDRGLSAPFPISRTSLWRKIARDLTGQTFFKQRIAPLFAGRKETRTIVVNEGQTRFLVFNAGLLAACVGGGIWWAYFALWIVPMATWFPLVTRLRNIAEHACVPPSDDPFRHARTTKANVLEGLLIAPYWVNYHAEHHMFMHLPCWSLPRAHALLAKKGRVADMITAPGYFAVLGQAAPG